jgi:nitroreductase
MDIIELMKKRKSIRHFKPEQPPQQMILDCLEAAAWAPNPTSQQPWKFIVVSGDSLKKVNTAIEENFATAFQKKEELPTPPLSNEMSDILQKRKDKAFQQMIATLKEKEFDMQSVGSGNFAFHHAPMGIIFATYPWKDQNFYKSTVAAMAQFLLAATARGLGTCWMNAVSICQESIKATLNLPSELVLVDGVAIGYPVEDSPLNQLPRERLPIDDVTVWL